MEDNVSWLQHSNDRFCIWKHLLNHICVTEALNRPQKPPNMVLYHGKFSQRFSQYPVCAPLTCGAVYPLFIVSYGIVLYGMALHSLMITSLISQDDIYQRKLVFFWKIILCLISFGYKEIFKGFEDRGRQEFTKQMSDTYFWSVPAVSHHEILTHPDCSSL